MKINVMVDINNKNMGIVSQAHAEYIHAKSFEMCINFLMTEFERPEMTLRGRQFLNHAVSNNFHKKPYLDPNCNLIIRRLVKL